jgi:pantoate--beta-alanine ligase
MSVGVIATAHDFRRACQEARRDGELALVPTMGYLHAGHQSLIRAAALRAPAVAVTIFVNPTQFAPSEDLSKYPRDIEGDLRKCEEAGATFVFAPRGPEEIYPQGFQTHVEPGPLAMPLCGEKRPGHFRGVCTVVAKLFALSRADSAFFGEKDYQQLAVIRRMNADLNLGVEVIGRPIVRESDGLALSSRNAYLSREERPRAVALWKALEAVRAAFRAGEARAEALEEIARQKLLEDELRIDYAEVRDPVELQRGSRADATSRLFLAAFLGKTRLIDNGALGEG